MREQEAAPTAQGFFRWGVFLAMQAVIVSIAVGATAYRSKQLEQARRLPPMQNTPPTIRPLYDDPRVVTDEQLDAVLYKLRPRLREEKVNINHVDHALRFWGVEAKFADPECLSGEEMRNLLLDHSQFQKVWGEEALPLLRTTKNGVGVRTQEGLATASHYDHTLAGLAEVGTTLDHPVQTPTGQTTVREMLEFALREFSLNQIEYEWSTLAFSMYLPPVNRWISTEGQEITFDRLADRIMRQKLNQGVCMGNHRLHALVMLLRIDDNTPILSSEGRQRIIDHLTAVTGLFIASQHPDGYWIRSWPSGQPPQTGIVGDTENTGQNRILATGHVLEWWALAPDVVHPPREVVIRAAQWLSRAVLDLDDSEIKRQYTFLSHAGRALALWRGDFPASFLPLRDETPAAATSDKADQDPATGGESAHEDEPAPEGQPEPDSNAPTDDRAEPAEEPAAGEVPETAGA